MLLSAFISTLKEILFAPGQNKIVYNNYKTIIITYDSCFIKDAAVLQRPLVAGGMQKRKVIVCSYFKLIKQVTLSLNHKYAI